MKNFSWKSLLPHAIAVGVFLMITLIFCKPALDSSVSLRQSDITAVAGMAKQSADYMKENGRHPLWITSMFSGMPAYQIQIDGPWSPLGIVHKIFSLGLPKPLNFFFLACIGFYILCLCMRIRPYIGIVASLAYAFCTYNPIIITEGHDTKMLAMAYAPALLGGILLIFEKRYLLGFALAALFASLQLMQNHPQISYYLFLTIGIMSIAYVIRWIKEKDFAHIGKAAGLTIAATAIGLFINAVLYFPVYDYAKYSKRGGQLIMPQKAGDTVKKGPQKTAGLSKEYAFQWSYGKMETFTLLVPGIKGYGSYIADDNGETYIYPKLTEKSKLAQYLGDNLNVPEDQAADFAFRQSTSLYWGDQPFTKGPVYLGAIVCLLFLFSMFYMDAKHRWWILAATVITIMMSWGKHFAGLNYFLFDKLPLYNKFRANTMILVIPQLLFPLAAALALNKLAANSAEAAWKPLRNSLIGMGAVLLLLAGYYFTTDYAKENTERTRAFNTLFAAGEQALTTQLDSLNEVLPPDRDNQMYEGLMFNTKGDKSKAKGVVSALRSDRRALFGKDLMITLVFVLLGSALLYFFVKKKINFAILLGGLGLLMMIDLLIIDTKYLNEKSFGSKESFEEEEFPKSGADVTILNDKDPNFRVFNVSTGDPFQESRTSYYHKSIGGYHPAKLGIYDDLVEHQLSGRMPNQGVINMLNAKYYIQSQGGNGQQPQPLAIANSGALGNCWFIKHINWVDSDVAEMQGLDGLNTRDSAVMQNDFKDAIGSFNPADSSATIRQTAFSNEAISYESNANAAHVAVFSEIFYKDWKAYIDGKEAPVAKANYVLRALKIPAGKHKIEFKFEASVYQKSFLLSRVGNIALFLLLGAFAFFEYRKRKSTGKV
jgi:hypothetical protein